MTGVGAVVPDGDAELIGARVEALTLDMNPTTPGGALMIRQMAAMSVRAERCIEHESAAIAERVRHAVDDFDEARIDRAQKLFDDLHEDPRGNLRRLKKMPEGVDRLVDAWSDLRDDLTSDRKGNWTAAHLEQAVLMTGTRPENARGSRLGILSRGVWGDFWPLLESEGGDLEEEARRRWCRARLVERVDEEIASLKAHRETLDFATIGLDRVEAPSRALFDASQPAILARRYEAATMRRYFKALDEFRRVEAEAAGQTEPSPTASNRPTPAPTMGSFGQTPPPPVEYPPGPSPKERIALEAGLPGDNGQPLTFVPHPKSPR